MKFNHVIEHLFDSMKIYLTAIEDSEYSRALDLFSNSSIGQHTRHVIEFFQCLIQQSDAGFVNYDNRKRNHRIEQETAYVCTLLDELCLQIKEKSPNQPLRLEVDFDAHIRQENSVHTTFERELIYLIEHTIHHLAIIKIGLKVEFPGISLPADFGVAPSTIKFQNSIRQRS